MMVSSPDDGSSANSSFDQQQLPHLHTIQALNHRTDINFSIETIYAPEMQLPQLSFMTDASDALADSSASTLCESSQDNQSLEFGPSRFGKSKPSPPPKLDFSSFNINEDLPTCGDPNRTRCCKSNQVSEQQTEINTPNPIKKENPFDVIQSQAVQMAMASEVEMPAPWADVAVLATKAVIPTSVAPDTTCLALPTGIPSYVDLPYQMSTATSTTSSQLDLTLIPSDTLPPTDSDVLDGNIVDSLLSDANQMYNNPHIQSTAQQMEADSILNEILRSIDNVHQTTSQMAKQAAARQGATSVLPQLTNLSSVFAMSPSPSPHNLTPTTSLEAITAEADICSCGTNCICDQNVGCQGGCGPMNPCRALPPQTEMDVDAAPTPKSTVSGECCGGSSCGGAAPKQASRPIKPVAAVRPKSLSTLEARNLVTSLVTSSCCGGDNKIPEPPVQKPTTCASSAGGGCTCKSPMEGISNGCCVVICLKTLEQLRSMLNNSTINLIRCSGGSGVS